MVFSVWVLVYNPHRKLLTLPSPAELIFKSPGNSQLPAAQPAGARSLFPPGPFSRIQSTTHSVPVMTVLKNFS